MNRLPLVLLVTAIVYAPLLAAEVLRLSSPVSSDAESETFGALLDEQHPRVSLGVLLANAEALLGQDLLVDARVAKVCQKKGCFFIATDGNQALRVAFKDHGFFVPTDAGGKQVTLTGQLVRRTLSPGQAAHFNADMGDDQPALQPGDTYEIVADAVRIARH